MKRVQLNYINGKTHDILSGVALGESARKQNDFDSLDLQPDPVEIEIPEKVISVNSSFFSGAFQKSIKTLGVEKFRKQYVFLCDDIIRQNIENGIFNIVKTFDLVGG